MSYFDPEDYGLQPVQDTVPRNWRREMEQGRKEAEDRAAEAEARLAEFERNRVFDEAGVPADGLGAVIRKGYDGEMTPAALRALLGAPAAAASTQASLAGHQQAAAMAAGAAPATTSNVAAEFAAMRASSRSKRNGGNFGADRQKLGELINREGVEPNPTNWQLPKQLVQN